MRSAGEQTQSIAWVTLRSVGANIRSLARGAAFCTCGLCGRRKLLDAEISSWSVSRECWCSDSLV